MVCNQAHRPQGHDPYSVLMTARLPAALALACLGMVLGGGAAAAPPLTTAPPTEASGYAVAVIGPDGSTLASSGQGGSFAYPADGSVVSVDSSLVSTSSSASDGTAYARTELDNASLFGGEITVSSLRAAVSANGADTNFSDSGITNLFVLGQSVSEPAANSGFALADWGSLSILHESSIPGS